MLSRFDDFPIHQTAAPIAHPLSGDRNTYDRYWFNGYSDDGSMYFGIGAARYPNLGILDCGFSIVHNGQQISFHGSRRAPTEPTDVTVGPFRIEVVEPMRRIRMVLSENDTGVAADLEFIARTACVEEGRQTMWQGPRLRMDVTRFAQFGRWEGQIKYDDVTIDVLGSTTPGTKDRSWGVRPVAKPDLAIAPEAPSGTQAFFAWAPLHWDDRCTHFGVFEDRYGRQWHSDGAILPVYDDPADIPGAEDPDTEILVGVQHYIYYQSGTRRARHARIDLIDNDGHLEGIDLEPLLCFRMKGIGYMHPEWGHGIWKGELEIAGERWNCDELDPTAVDNQHIQQVVRARSGDRVGIGVLEQISFGPHARYGFKELLDMAP
jgi:hypothetical protein